jgi:hypothetical protein
VLHEHRARYVMIHWRLYPPGEGRRVRVLVGDLASCLRPIVDADSVSLYEIVGWPEGAVTDAGHSF